MKTQAKKHFFTRRKGNVRFISLLETETVWKGELIEESSFTKLRIGNVRFISSLEITHLVESTLKLCSKENRETQSLKNKLWIVDTWWRWLHKWPVHVYKRGMRLWETVNLWHLRSWGQRRHQSCKILNQFTGKSDVSFPWISGKISLETNKPE